MAWNWDDSDEKHRYHTKNQRWLDNGASTSAFDPDLTLSLNEVKPLPPSDPATVSFWLWDTGPTIAISKYGNDSQGYWAWTTTISLPLPSSVSELYQGDGVDCSISLAILADAKQPYGEYTQPENVHLTLHGFGQHYKTEFVAPKIRGGAWFAEIFTSARVQATEVTPAPYIVLSFNTENVGGVQGSVAIDWDVALNIAISFFGAKMALRALR